MVVDSRVGHVFVAVSTDPYGGIRTGPTTLFILDSRTLRVLHTTKLGIGPTSLALDSPTNRLIAANQGDDTATIVDAESGVVLHISQVAAWPSPVVIDTQLSRAFILGKTPDHQAHALSMLDMRTGAIVRTLHDIGRPSGGLIGAVVDEVTHHVFVANNGAGYGRTPMPSLEMLDGRTGQLLSSIPIAPRSLQIDPPLVRLFVTEEPDTVWVLNSHTGAIEQKISLPNYQRTASAQIIALDTLSQHVFVAGYWPGVTMVDARTGKILRPRQQSNGATELAVDEQSRRAVAAGVFGVVVLDSRTGAVVRRITPDDIARFPPSD
jgi:hypothetical protein